MSLYDSPRSKVELKNKTKKDKNKKRTSESLPVKSALIFKKIKFFTKSIYIYKFKRALICYI